MSQVSKLALYSQLLADALFLLSFCVVMFGWISLRDALDEQ